MADPYKDLTSNGGRFAVNFLDGVRVTLPASPAHDVILYDESGKIRSMVANVTAGAWFPFHWFERWRVVVERCGVPVFEHTFNTRGRRVLVSFDSNSMGDTLAWIPFVELFRETTGATVIACTHHNEWFDGRYDFEFVEPGTEVPNLYAATSIGWYYHATETAQPHPMRSPIDFRKHPLQATAAAQLNVMPGELRPRLAPMLTESKPPIDEPYVCLGIHSTAQAKYWNHPTGWAEVAAWLKARGWRVFVASREESGYMGNAHPPGLERLPNYEIGTTAHYIKHAATFVGVGSGLSWLAWALEVPTVLISGFSMPWTEPRQNITRIKPPTRDVCQGCFNRERLTASDWQWCPNHKDTARQFECTKSIEPKAVIEALAEILVSS